MTPIAQFLLTRFNIPMHQRPGQNLDPTWLAHRLALFRRYCLPSVKAQTWHGFRWFIAVDDRTPPPFLKEILSSELPAFCSLILVRPNEEFQQRIRTAIALLNLPHDSRIVSTRMDNDDAIAPGYMAMVRATAESQLAKGSHLETSTGGGPVPPFFIDSPRGHTYETWGDIFRPRSYEAHATALSPFLSLVEPWKERPWTAFCGDHGHLREKFPGWRVYQLFAPQWVQVIHGQNVANAISGCDPLPESSAEALKRQLGWTKA